MKKLLFLLVASAFALTVNAQEAAPKKKAPAKEKAHTCSTACKDGKHAYACGEKGHTCSADCKKMCTEKPAGMAKEHVCTAACTADKHAYVCGEKGHTCSGTCKSSK